MSVSIADEDELLNTDLEQESQSTIHEPETKPLTSTDEFDYLSAEQELLGEEPASSLTASSRHETSFDKEELDYDEEEDDEVKEERTSKFTSERNQTSASNSSSTIPSSNDSDNHSKRPYNNNRNNRGRNFRGGYNNNNRRNLPPSLFSLKLQPPIGLNSKILLNPNFVPHQHQPPLVRLNMPGAPPITMAPPGMPPMVPIVPRLPNGIPLVPAAPNVGLPPNHGMAGFGVPPPALPHQVGYAHGGGPPYMNHPPHPAAWDQKVASFLNQRPPQHKRRRSSSYSSYSSTSRSSSSRSRSRSRSPRRRQDRRRRHEKERVRERDDRRTREKYRSSRGSSNYRSGRGGERRDRRDTKEVQEECAKVVGVDNDYLNKLEDQRRQREEIKKRKEQRRYGNDDKRSSSSTTTSSSKKPVEREEPPKSSTSIEALKKKAYLCVIVKNLKGLPTAHNRIESLAKELGAIRKCWKVGDDQVNIIFSEHDNAKAFMLKFNNKVLSGLRINVLLEKAYLSQAEVQ